MRYTLLTCLCLLFVAPAFAADGGLTSQQISDGWVSLFDGKTLFGWQATSEANWRVESSEIRVDAGPAGWLMTTTEFADFHLHLQFKTSDKSNSGVFVRTNLAPEDPLRDCYEVNIAPLDNPFPTGSLVARQKVEADTSFSEEGWQTLEIFAKGPDVRVLLNGDQVCELNDPQPLLRGHIGLQFMEGPIAFREVRLKPLGLTSIFNGKDLSGWKDDRAEESEFTVTSNGELQVSDGPGQLESTEKYGDFVLQLDCFVNGEGLNSGIFFRCIPGDKMMGYESQIHNGMIDGDPTKPEDCGTGGIFRRQNARRIVAEDFQWFTKTIIADGPHMAVWVNGYQVSDWTDERSPDENPRRGLRLAPGTLMIQGHDPTTDLRFRNLRAVELPKRQK